MISCAMGTVGPGTSKEARLDKIEGMKYIWSNFIFLLLFLSNLFFFYLSIWYTLPSHLTVIARVGCGFKNKEKWK